MAQANLKYLVEDADLRVQQCDAALTASARIFDAGARGQDATLAKRLLAISEEAFEIHVANRVRLSKGPVE
jgi:hypothetical protein